MWVMKTGGSFKSFTVLLANTTISESGSIKKKKEKNIGKRKKNHTPLYIKIIKIEKRERKLPEGFQVKASLNLWPSTSMSNLIGTEFSAVGLP